MKVVNISIGSLMLLFAAVKVQAALPTPFFECLNQRVTSQMGVSDMKELIKVAPMTYCANQPTLINKNEMRELLQQGSNFRLAINLAQTTFTATELREMAQARPYTLYVDSSRLSISELMGLSEAGVRMAVMTSSAGLNRTEILQLANSKQLVLNVTSPVSQADLLAYLNAGVHLVIRTSVANLNRTDLVALSTAQPDLVTLVP